MTDRPTTARQSYQGRLDYINAQIRKGFKPSAADRNEMTLLRKWLSELPPDLPPEPSTADDGETWVTRNKDHELGDQDF